MRAIFQKMAKKKCKIFENSGKNVQNLKIFSKKTSDCVRLPRIGLDVTYKSNLCKNNEPEKSKA